jgi:hypothetical protein
MAMRRVDPLWFTLLSEVLVNLAAGWVGFGLASMFAVDKDILTKFGLLTGNLVFAILSLIAAFKLRKRKR